MEGGGGRIGMSRFCQAHTSKTHTPYKHTRNTLYAHTQELSPFKLGQVQELIGQIHKETGDLVYFEVCCSVLQCVAVCCSVLQCLAISCRVDRVDAQGDG